MVRAEPSSQSWKRSSPSDDPHILAARADVIVRARDGASAAEKPGGVARCRLFDVFYTVGLSADTAGDVRRRLDRERDLTHNLAARARGCCAPSGNHSLGHDHR
ncbi:MAG: hypothetical protein QOH12_3031 [Solirubrobacteraceae bacterium]|nr:hypothetical protein [Solirubrobacteraceae bacterium]